MSGLSDLAGALVVSSFMELITAVIVVAVMYMFFMRITFGPKSYRYRKLLTDMYIAGKVKEKARKEGINLSKETNEFKKMLSGKKDLDDQIEENLITELQEKKEGSSK